MRLIYGILFCVQALVAQECVPQEAELSVRIMRSAVETKHQKTKLALVSTVHDALLIDLAPQLQHYLAESGQCDVALIHGTLPKSKQELAHYDEAGYQFAFFMGLEDASHAITGRLYDVPDQEMLQGKKWQHRETRDLWVAALAHDIWQQLMGHGGSFASKIIYVRRTHGKLGKEGSQLCMTSWDGRGEKVILSSNALLVAPTWSHDGERIFCSQFTDRNVRLIATDLHGKSWVVVNRDGTTTGASSVAGCADVVYCHSGEIWKCSYDAQRKKFRHQLIVRDGTMCASPTLLSNGDVIYCAGGRIKRWHASKKFIEPITQEGYCAGPSYHAPSARLVYSQKIDKQMQLFVHDLRTGKRRQLTCGAGDKIDPSFSPCAGYIVYCLMHGSRSEIILFNMITGKEQRISPAGERCSCPAWSPNFAH